VQKFEVDPKRLSAAGMGHYRPISEKQDEWGRSKNRRIEVIILNNVYKEP
jgi:chemotaxis protein MotB